jgi:PAS domain-containing protein
MRLADLQTIFLGEVEVPAEHRDAVSAARRKTFHSLAPLAAIHSLLNAVVLTFAFWNHPAMPLVFVWCYTSAVLVFIRMREARRPEGQLDAKIEDGRIVRYTLLSGALWGAMIAVLIASSGEEHALLLGVFTAAILCVGALLHSSFPLASLGYSLMIGVGAGVGMMIGVHHWSFNAVLLIAAGVMTLQRFAASNHAADIRRHLANAAMQDAKDTVGLLLQDFEAHSADWLWRVDAQGRLGKASQRFIDATGLPQDILEGGSLLALFAPESVHQLQDLLRQRKPFRDEVLRVAIGSRESWWSISGQPMADGGWRGVCSDITRSRDAEARIAYVTEYDSLTDLPNRAMLCVSSKLPRKLCRRATKASRCS